MKTINIQKELNNKSQEIDTIIKKIIKTQII
jgi:hypothetical protein